MAQIKINIEKADQEILEQIKNAKELYVNAEPVEKTKWDSETKTSVPDGYRTEIQIMDTGIPIFRQTFLVKTMDKPAVSINDKVALEVTNNGYYFTKNEVIPWYSGILKKASKGQDLNK
ncbi:MULTISPECIES: hypothetical protein [Lactococcus]|jgi:hypothetical protein|uniref:hypothetical protein n=1 Tax=Lactococcus TaxID=1357 RepID=UPI001430BFA2|nr:MULTISPECIES: hypothetical protein [Lactococcus]KAF6610171.1 hypothetical protein HFD74_07420 [Lactococcus sp. EKM201L]KAF6612893.1 hypothetical protein HFD15_07990 [Lactococcus sp. EKM203L]KAF6643378.1 hypothetical protein HFC73_04810 [Lactococcus sp. EKM501L]KAF6646926.1 hypothetical protein HFC72_04810 [Lactococcus sp. EKM502L]KAF6651823.1 hypothetical protein HFC74_08045 [Lactococcus sp. EKM101L]